MLKTKAVFTRLPIAIVAGGALVYNQASSALFSILLAKILGVSDYGLVNLARSVFSIVIVISPFGLDLALQRHLGQRKKIGAPEAAEIFLTRLFVLAISVAVLGVLAFGVADLISQNFYKYPGFSRIFLITFAALPFATDLAVVGGAYRGLREPTPTILTNAFLLPTLRMFSIVLLFWFTNRVNAVILGTLISYAASAAVGAVIFQRRLPIWVSTLGTGWPGAMEIIRYAPLLEVGTFLFMLARSLDVVLLGHLASFGDVGRYSVALMAGQVVSVVGAALGQTLGAEIAGAASRRDDRRMQELLVSVMKRASLLCAPFCVEIAFWGSDVDLLLGAGYLTPRSVFVLIAVAQWISSSFNYGSWALVATGRNFIELGNNVIALVVQLVFCVTLIPHFGMAGAAASSFVMLATLTALRQAEITALFGRRLIRVSMLGPLAVSTLLAAPIYYTQTLCGLRTWWLTAICVGSHAVASFAIILAADSKGDMSVRR